jgi:putative FmdB family regulatory protein
MPTYQYQCKKCGHELEELQSMTEPPLVRCPKCNTDSLARVMATGTALIFKGSGFYLTDYKKQSGRPATGDNKEKKDSEKKDSEKKDSEKKDSEKKDDKSSSPSADKK